VLCVITFAIVKQEHFIYYWDYSGIWPQALNISEYICEEPYKALSWLYSSILNDEYNMWRPLLLGLPLRILGQSYAAYVTSLVLCFLMPTAATYAALIQKIMCSKKARRIPTPLLFSFFAFSGAMLIPTFFGYGDAPCVFLISILTVLAIETDLTKFQPRNIVLMGILIAQLALMRRSYDYWIIAYAVVCAILAVISIFRAKEPDRRHMLKGSVLNAAVLCGIGLPIMILFWGYIKTILAFDVGFRHQAWTAAQNQSNINRWLCFLGNYGPVILLAAIASVVVAWKEVSQVKRTVFVSVGCIGILIAKKMPYITGIVHGFYWITGQILLLAGLGIYCLFNKATRWKTSVVFAALVLFTGVNFLISFHVIPVNSFTKCLFQSTFYEKKNSESVDDTMLVLDALDDLPEDCPRVYVLGTDFEFNDDILRNARLPEGFKGAQIYTTAHVDFRDGFFESLLEADYVLTIDPIEFHLEEQYQKVVSIPNQMIADKTTAFGECYVEVERIPFTDRTVSIRKRMKVPSIASVRELEAAFDKVYPEYPQMFHDRFEAYISSNSLK